MVAKPNQPENLNKYIASTLNLLISHSLPVYNSSMWLHVHECWQEWARKHCEHLFIALGVPV